MHDEEIKEEWPALRYPVDTRTPAEGQLYRLVSH